MYLQTRVNKLPFLIKINRNITSSNSQTMFNVCHRVLQDFNYSKYGKKYADLSYRITVLCRKKGVPAADGAVATSHTVFTLNIVHELSVLT